MVWLIALGYVAGWAAAFWLFVDAWRHSDDVTQSTAVFLAILSIGGPLSLLPAAIVWVVERTDNLSSPVIWERK